MACAQSRAAEAPQSAGDPTFPRCAAQGVDSGQAFVAKKVSFLPAGFDPRSTSGYKSPQCNSPVGAPYSASLAKAFDLAPALFKEHLCGLTCVFVNQQPCKDPANCTVEDTVTNSWGFREQPSQSKAAGRYIATSQSLWGGQPPSPENLNIFQARILNRLLAGAAGPTHDLGVLRNGPEMTVLAALAHELGHVRWFDANVQTPGGAYDFKYTIPCVGSSVSFFDLSWKFADRANLEVPSRWRGFGEWADPTLVSSNRLEHKRGPFIAEIRSHMSSARSFGVINDRLHLANQPWPSFFGSMTPDEDFVETYRLWVLTNAGLKSFSLKIPFASNNNPVRQDIVGDLIHGRKSALGQKIDCVAAIPY